MGKFDLNNYQDIEYKGEMLSIENTSNSFIDKIEISGGKNLFDAYNMLFYGETPNVTHSENDVIVQSTAGIKSYFIVPCEIGKTYKFHCNYSKNGKIVLRTLQNYDDDIETNYVRQYFSATNETEELVNTVLSVTIESGENFIVGIIENATADTVTFNEVQLEKSPIATDYEPYKEITSPINVKSVGKNLIDIPNQYNIQVYGYMNVSSEVYTDFILSPNTDYTLSFDYVLRGAESNINYVASVGRGSGENYSTDIKLTPLPNKTEGRSIVTFKSPSDLDTRPYLALRFIKSSSSTQFNYDISNIQFELGNTATDYEPYQSSEAVIPIKDRLGNEYTLYTSEDKIWVDDKGSFYIRKDGVDHLASYETQGAINNIKTFEPITHIFGTDDDRPSFKYIYNKLNFITRQELVNYIGRVRDVEIDQIQIEGRVFKGVSNYACINSKSYIVEPVRGNDGSIADIDNYDTFIVPRVMVNFKYMNISDFRDFVEIVNSQEKNQFEVKYYDYEKNEWVKHMMYLTPREATKLYNIGLSAVGVLDLDVNLVGTLNPVEEEE